MSQVLSPPRSVFAYGRGNTQGIISQAKRREQMQPIGAEQVGCVGRERTRYLLEVAQFKLANCLFDEARQMAQEALAIELRRFFVAVFDKPNSPILETDRLLLKLRSSCVITRKEYRYLRSMGRLTNKCGGPAVERAIEAVARLADPHKGGAPCQR